MAHHSADKKSIADASLNEKILTLLSLVSRSPALTFKENKSSAKLFELRMLFNILKKYKRVGNVVVKNAKNGVLYLAGAPASANKSKFSYFELCRNQKVEHEVWISVQFISLSYELKLTQLNQSISGTSTSKIPPSAKHEIDVGVFEPIPKNIRYPSYRNLCAGFSCKHLKPTKECVREVLGFRRETGFLSGPNNSLINWLTPQIVPTRPPSPMYLASSSLDVLNYKDPVELVGVYMLYVSFPG